MDKDAKQTRKDYLLHNVQMSMQELVTAGSWLLDLDRTSFDIAMALAHVAQAKEVLEIYRQRLTQNR